MPAMAVEWVMTTVVAPTSSLSRAMAERTSFPVSTSSAPVRRERDRKKIAPACGAGGSSSPDEHHHKHYHGKRDY